jgi:hypothetical protein
VRIAYNWGRGLLFFSFKSVILKIWQFSLKCSKKVVEFTVEKNTFPKIYQFKQQDLSHKNSLIIISLFQRILGSQNCIKPDAFSTPKLPF